MKEEFKSLYKFTDVNEILLFYSLCYYKKDVNKVLEDVLIDYLKKHNSNALFDDIKIVDFDRNTIIFIYENYTIKGWKEQVRIINPLKCNYEYVHPITKININQSMYEILEKEFMENLRFKDDYDDFNNSIIRRERQAANG